MTGMRVLPITAKECVLWLRDRHYAKRIPSIAKAFGLYQGSWIIGLVTYGIPATGNLNQIAGFPGIELNRLVVNDDAPKNSSSILVGRSLRALDKPRVVISYADTDQGHIGYIYQATNWIYTGVSRGDTEFLKDGRTFHRKALFNVFGTGSAEFLKSKGYEPVKQGQKHRYVFLIGSKTQKSKMRKNLPWPELNYPKGQTMRYDSGNEVTTQGLLL